MTGWTISMLWKANAIWVKALLWFDICQLLARQGNAETCYLFRISLETEIYYIYRFQRSGRYISTATIRIFRWAINSTKNILTTECPEFYNKWIQGSSLKLKFGYYFGLCPHKGAFMIHLIWINAVLLVMIKLIGN